MVEVATGILSLDNKLQQVRSVYSMSLLLSDEIVQASGLLERELLLEVVIVLFQREKISLGKASELLALHHCGMILNQSSRM